MEGPLSSELSIEPVFGPTERIESVVSQPVLPSHPLADSLVSVSRLVLPILPQADEGLEPQPSLPGTAWTASLQDEMLPLPLGRASLSVVLPGEWIPLVDEVDRRSSASGGSGAIWTGSEISLDVEADLVMDGPVRSKGSLDSEMAEADSEWMSELELDFEESPPGAAVLGSRSDEAQAGPADDAGAEDQPVLLPEESTLKPPAARPRPVKSPPRARSSGAKVSPTLRAVVSTLRSTRETKPVRLGTVQRSRVYLELEDGCSLEGQVSPAAEEGVDSVWLEVDDPVEDTTLWEELPPAARAGADLLADGGAVRVDLSLGSKDAPDLEQVKAGLGASKPEAVRSWVGDSTKDLRGRTTDLVALARWTVGGPGGGGGEEQETDDGPLLEDRITEDEWVDEFGGGRDSGESGE